MYRIMICDDQKEILKATTRKIKKILSGSEISDKVQKTLITAGFSPLITNLITPSAGNFSYNLSIDFFPKGFSPESIFSEYKTYAVFVFRQNDFLENSDKSSG